MAVFVVTGTDTGVGKTIVTAAIAVAAAARDLRVCVIKPGQSGIAPGSGEESDVDTVARLADPAGTQTLANYPDPLSPLAAARESGLPALAVGDAIEAATVADERYDVVLIEGSGGLLSPMGEGWWTVADLALALRCPAVVVTRAGLGTINHTSLTLEAMEGRGIPGLVVIGAWPAVPELVHWRNLADLPGQLAGVVPEGAGTLSPERFRRSAPEWLTGELFGRARPERLRTDGVPGPPPAWPEPVDLP